MKNTFQNYMLAQANSKVADAELNHASVALELAHIKERLAEIASQAEPLNGLREHPISERDRLYSAAFYVVVGRMPELEG